MQSDKRIHSSFPTDNGMAGDDVSEVMISTPLRQANVGQVLHQNNTVGCKLSR